MKEAMSSSGCVGLYTLEEVDIETDAELFASYRFEIPVLYINGVEAFRHHLRPDVGLLSGRVRGSGVRRSRLRRWSSCYRFLWHDPTEEV